MKQFKFAFFAVMVLCAVAFIGCSKEEDGEAATFKLEANLVDGYYYNGSKTNQAIRFFKDHTFMWMERNEFDKYDRDSEGVYSGVWTVENETDIVLKWDHDYTPTKKAPTLMLRTSFVDGKMAFADQTGANCLYTKDTVSTFIDKEMIGYTLKAGNAYSYGGMKLKNSQTLVFQKDGYVKWTLEERFFDSDVLRHQYAATGKTWRNVSESEIYIEWFYEGEGEPPYHEVVCPPDRMTDLKLKKSEKGEWLIYFENGYDYLKNTNYVRK